MKKEKYWRAMYAVVNANQMVALWFAADDKSLAWDHAEHCISDQPDLKLIEVKFQGWDVPNAVLGAFLPAGTKHG
jgi:hypothetical protein